MNKVVTTHAASFAVAIGVIAPRRFTCPRGPAMTSGII